MVKIVQKNDPVLRKISEPVPKEMFGSEKLKKILKDMGEALDSQDDGVAIAAPQIAVSLRIFMISNKVLDILYPEEDHENVDHLVFINPKILRLSKEREITEEGCLSVRYLYGKTKRAKKAKIKAQDENGHPFEMGASGLIAQIFQHEMEHLDGHLFIDHAFDVHDLPPRV